MENPNLEKLENSEKSSWGGKRDNSGRKPLMNKEEMERVRELIAQHGVEFDGVARKERCLALLDILYEEGFSKRNIMAIKEYLDRQLGKPSQGIDLTTKGKEFPTPMYAGQSNIPIQRHEGDSEDIPTEEED